MTTENLMVLSLSLPRGYASLVKKKLRGKKRNISAQYISQIKTGVRTDDVVMEALLEVAEENKKQLSAKNKERTARLKKLATA
jgi:predicted RNA-binding protein with RPS1 domain